MNWLWVACGGAIGASMRYGLSLLLPTTLGQFPWATWWANVLGCLFIGLFAVASEKFLILQGDWRLFAVVGLLGGFTTFSSFGLESFNLLRMGCYGLALLYVVSSFLAGLAMIFCSFIIFRMVSV